ncbi:hypothetical protein EDD86DRAFT_194879 [Gorgonomyces haynaldii]|nr:hypothetical protein EDD86DRAFT_194879 [Gorgonomyces haynaldii]
MLLALPTLSTQRTRLIPTLLDIFNQWVMATPKKKTTHRKKRLRMATKWTKPMRNIRQCPMCGSDKLNHHLCLNCMSKLA